jgi:hypothetical protein
MTACGTIPTCGLSAPPKYGRSDLKACVGRERQAHDRELERMAKRIRAPALSVAPASFCRPSRRPADGGSAWHRRSRAKARSRTTRPATASELLGNRLLNDFVGASKEVRRQGQAQRFRSFQVNHQFEFDRLFDWQVRRLGTFHNLVHDDCSPTI